MASLNQVTLMGNLCRDPEIKYLQSGAAVCEVGLAVNETYKDKEGNKKESVLFIDCTCWNKTAELVCEYLRKGNSVLFTGRLRQETWEKDGAKHSKIKMTVDKLVMLGSKNNGTPRPEPEPPRTEERPAPVYNDKPKSEPLPDPDFDPSLPF